MARVIWSREALARLDLISLYIAEFNPVAADKMARKLLDAGNSLRHFPDRGRPASKGTRELSTVPPYIIRYVVQDGDVTILRIRHAAQSPLGPDLP